jgi:hypothetical protein
MKDKAKKLSFANIQVNKIHDFLTRFLEFDDNLLLEINSEELYAKTYTPDRSAIKYSALPFEEVLQIKEDSEIPELLKVGLINIKQYQQALKFFSMSEQVSMNIQYLTLAGLDIDEENVATKTTINNNNDLQFSFENGSLSIYGTITNDKFFNEIANINEPTFKFNLNLEDLQKIKKFVAIDKVDMNLDIEYKNGSVIFGNQTFKYRLPSDGIEGTKDTKARFPKEYLAMLDGESYSILVGESRIVFESKDSKTFVVVGRNDA